MFGRQDYARAKKQIVSRENAPRGTLTGTFEELHSQGCIQTGTDVYSDIKEAATHFLRLFSALKIATNGNLCDGCPAFNYGNCKAFKKYHSSEIQKTLDGICSAVNATTPPGTAKYPGMSVRQIAEKLGISIGEVRRRKQAGLL